MSYIYLMSPYSHDDPKVRGKRYRGALNFTARQLKKSIIIYSPIVHCHEIALKLFVDPPPFEFWRKYDAAFLRHAYAGWVLMLPGWNESVGVKEEVAIAKSIELPIYYLEPAEEDLDA